MKFLLGIGIWGAGLRFVRFLSADNLKGPEQCFQGPGRRFAILPDDRKGERELIARIANRRADSPVAAPLITSLLPSFSTAT